MDTQGKHLLQRVQTAPPARRELRDSAWAPRHPCRALVASEMSFRPPLHCRWAAAAGGIALTSPRASRPPGTPHAQRERETSERVRADTDQTTSSPSSAALLALSLSLHPAGDVSTRRAFGPLPRSRPTGRGKRHATILGAARGHGDRTFAGACVCGARAAQVPLPRALEIRFPMRPHLVARFESGRDPARSRKLGGGRKKRGGASIPAAAVAWRGVALSAYPTGYHTMPCIPGVARVHDGWEWLSYSRTRRADGGTRTAARCTPRCGRLGSAFFPTPPSPRRACRRRPCIPPLPFLI